MLVGWIISSTKWKSGDWSFLFGKTRVGDYGTSDGEIDAKSNLEIDCFLIEQLPINWFKYY